MANRFSATGEVVEMTIDHVGRSGTPKLTIRLRDERHTDRGHYEDWIDVCFLGPKASKYEGLIRQGDRLMVSGYIKGRSWMSPQGEQKIFHDFNAHECHFLRDPEADATPPAVDYRQQAANEFGDDDLPF